MKKSATTLLLLFLACFASAQTGTIVANGIKIAYESFGDSTGQPIILIQGTGASMTDWPLEFCHRLAKRRNRVIRFDNRDVGTSTKLDSLGLPDWSAISPFIKTCGNAPLPYTIMDMAKDVIGLMDGLSIEKAHLVGASMGGAIAQLVAINFPTRVMTLTTIAASSGNPNLPPAQAEAFRVMSSPPPSTTNKDTLVQYMQKVYRALGSVDDDVTLRKRALQHINHSWYPEGTARQVAAIAVGDNCDRRKDLTKVNVPAIIIHGDVDPLVSVEAANDLASSIANAELYIVNGMGHDLSLPFINSIADLVLRNVKKVETEQAMK